MNKSNLTSDLFIIHQSDRGCCAPRGWGSEISTHKKDVPLGNIIYWRFNWDCITNTFNTPILRNICRLSKITQFQKATVYNICKGESHPRIISYYIFTLWIQSELVFLFCYVHAYIIYVMDEVNKYTRLVYK